MARRHARRRRRGRFSFLYRIFSLLLICALFVAALTLFFKVKGFEISGNTRYTDEQILSASGLHTEGNLFLLNKYAAANDIFRKLPYISEVSIRRDLPDTICIDVKETVAAAVLYDDMGALWRISPKGKILEPVDEKGELALVSGLTIEAAQEGEMMTLANTTKQDALFRLLAALDARAMLQETQAIYLEDDSYLTMRYQDRFTVRLLWTADFDYKMESLCAIVQRLEANETGLVNMTQDGKVNFIPE